MQFEQRTRSVNAFLTRCVWGCLWICSLLPVKAFAQKGPWIEYRIRFDSPISSAQEKGILVVLHTVDPGIQISCARGHDQAKARSSVQLDRDALNAQLIPYGIQVELMMVVLEGEPEERLELDVFFSGFPHYEDTGDPEVDQANYATAKAAWIDAHPGLYESLITNGAMDPAIAK